MTAPVFISAENSLQSVKVGENFALTGSEARHAAVVVRIAPNEEIFIIDGSGARITVRVAAISPEVVEGTVTNRFQQDLNAPEIVLVQAIAKGDRDLQAIEASCELGVNSVYAWQAARSIAKVAKGRESKFKQKWEAILLSAVKQSRRATIPSFEGVLNSKELAKLISEETATGTFAFILHESATAKLWQQEIDFSKLTSDNKILLIVGPEGGISDQELASFADAGAKPVLLASNVLRTSNAGPAAISVLGSLTKLWN